MIELWKSEDDFFEVSMKKLIQRVQYDGKLQTVCNIVRFVKLCGTGGD